MEEEKRIEGEEEVEVEGWKEGRGKGKEKSQDIRHKDWAWKC